MRFVLTNTSLLFRVLLNMLAKSTIRSRAQILINDMSVCTGIEVFHVFKKGEVSQFFHCRYLRIFCPAPRSTFSLAAVYPPDFLPTLNLLVWVVAK